MCGHFHSSLSSFNPNTEGQMCRRPLCGPLKREPAGNQLPCGVSLKLHGGSCASSEQCQNGRRSGPVHSSGDCNRPVKKHPEEGEKGWREEPESLEAENNPRGRQSRTGQAGRASTGSIEASVRPGSFYQEPGPTLSISSFVYGS